MFCMFDFKIHAKKGRIVKKAENASSISKIMQKRQIKKKMQKNTKKKMQQQGSGCSIIYLCRNRKK